VNSGAGLEYRPDGVNRIKIVISGQGVMDLKNSAIAFRYRPIITGAGYEARVPIFGSDASGLFEVENFQINTTSAITGSSRSDIFNQMMKIFQGRDQKKNNWVMAADGTEVCFSPAELLGTGGNLTAVPTLQRKAYQK